VDILSFDDMWPHRIAFKESHGGGEVWMWLIRRFGKPATKPMDRYTWLNQHTIGFNDPKDAMEFKLYWS
jgi:hypothetical protein